MLFQVWINNEWNPLHIGAVFGYCTKSYCAMIRRGLLKIITAVKYIYYFWMNWQWCVP